jgi:hypothetical protein
MRRFILVWLLSVSQLWAQSPRTLAEEHIGRRMLESYLHKPLPEVLRLVDQLPANQRRTIGKSILLNLYGHNYDTTLTHDEREVQTFTRVFYDDETAPDFFADIEKLGKKVYHLRKIQSGAKPGTFHEFEFKDLGLFFRFNQSKKIEVITVKKLKGSVKT